MITTGKIFWKRSAEWVTGLRHKYAHDPFFRTECNVIALQVVFVLVLLVFVSLAFEHLYRSIVEVLLEGIEAALRGDGEFTAEALLDMARSAKTANFIEVLALTALSTAFFGYVVTRIALTPARTALATQKRFISDIAHELRTPLSVIKTNSEVALLGEGLEPSVRDTFKSTVEELDRTSEIINNLLSFSALTQPREVSFSLVDIGPVIEGAAAKLSPLIKTKRQSLSVRKQPPHVVWGNATALEQILVNLLKNAANYTPEEGRIEIAAHSDYLGSTIVTVEDTGTGIARKDLPHIFEPFFRAEQSRSRKRGGSGLGLAIVSELVRLHHGKIMVKSTPGKGTCVTLYLPYHKAGAVSLPAPASTTRKSG